MVLLRADGTPTYMLSVVVDDHDMAVSHVIRGDDHLTNAFRQTQLYRALGWDPPAFAHIPLIHGADGAKLSKRHGALGIEAYREMGYLPEALRNYLLRLGWAHGDEEVISTKQAVEWFDLDAVGRSAARFDFAKLDSLNGHYIRESAAADLLPPVRDRLEARSGRTLDAAALARLERGLAGLKPRAKTLEELAENAAFYVAERPLVLTDKAAKLITPEAAECLARLLPGLEAAADWREETLEQAVRDFTEAEGLKLGQVAQPLRAALAGSTVSPGIFEVMAVLGRDECLGRIADQAKPL
jgi:glutamyl-tRNA synthetase